MAVVCTTAAAAMHHLAGLRAPRRAVSPLSPAGIRNWYNEVMEVVESAAELMVGSIDDETA